jgi:hypothetical protein
MSVVRSAAPGLLLLVVAASAPAQDKPDLRPATDWKGTPAELGFPADWLAYFPTAKVGDFVEDADKFGRRRNEVVEVAADALVVARVIENAKAERGRMELRFRYKLSEADKKKVAGGPAKAPAKGKAKEPQFETIKVGDTEVKCRVVKSGKTTTWRSDELPFDGVAKKDSPGDKFHAVAFGRGR